MPPQKNRTRVSLIFGEYNLPTQPYLKTWSDSLLNAEQIVSRNFSAHDTANSIVEKLGSLNRRQKMLRLVSIILKNPMLLRKWTIRKNGQSFARKLSHLAGYGPLMTFEPDVVHLVNSHLFPPFSSIIKELNCRSVVSFRGYDILVRPWNDDNWMLTLQDIFICIDSLHFVSKHLQEEAILLGAPPEKCRVIYPSIDLSQFKNSESSPQKNGKIKLVSTGRLVWQKNFPRALQVVRLLVNRGVDVEYAIIGDGVERDHLTYMIRALNLEKHVQLKGQLNQADVHYELQTADIYFQPSETEALGVAIVEAAAMGKAIVASNVGGIPEVIQNQVSGLLVSPYDIEGMTEAIYLFTSNPVLREQLGKAAAQAARERFSIESETREWVNLYHSLLH